jgi:peptide/nickel transport system substrate-binding protein
MRGDYWQRYTRERVARRRLLSAAGAVALGAAGLSLPGCGADRSKTGASGSDSGASPSPTATVTRGGTIRFPVTGFATPPVRVANPFVNNAYGPHTVSSFHYSRLLRHASGPGIEPTDLARVEGDLAEKWEQPDSLTYVFTLKPNVKWHDKAPLNGRAATASDYVRAYEVFARTSPSAATWTTVVDKMAATDDRTLRVSMKAAYAPFLSLRAASDRDMWLIAPEAIDGGQATSDPVGTGPYVFESFQGGAFISWRRNPSYYDSPLPNFDRVEGGLIWEPQKVVAALQSGGYDFAQFNALSYKDAHATLDSQGTSTIIQSNVLNAFHFNFDNRPFNDLRVRRALSMAFDRAGFLKLADPTGQGNWCSFLPPGVAPYYLSPRESNAEYGANGKFWNRSVNDARDLLRAATGTDTLSFKLVTSTDIYGPDFKNLVDLTVATIADAGFQAEVVDQPYFGGYITTTYRGQIPANGIGFGPLSALREPDEIFDRNYHSAGVARNWGGTPIPEQKELDAMFEKQRTLFDAQEREKYIKDIQLKMADSFLVVPLVWVPTWVYAQPWLKNFSYKDSWAYMPDSVMKANFTPERVARG